MNLNEAIATITSLQKAAYRSYKNAPAGKLRITKNHNNYYYYLVSDNKYGRFGQYIPKSKQSLIKQLAQKEYDHLFLLESQKVLAMLNSSKNKALYIDDYSKTIYSLQNVYLKMHPEKQKLVTPLVESDNEFIEKWLHQEYEHMPINNSLGLITTNSGIQVRSKSEKIIADKLTALEIPFIYEMPLRLKNGLIIHPDFVILDIAKRRNIYYEHFGMMDNPEYSSNAIRKIREYEENGFELGNTLLVSFETSTVPISNTFVNCILPYARK